MSRRGAYSPVESNQKVHKPPSGYAPDEIRKSMFLPLMKKALMGGRGGRLSLSYYMIICTPFCVFPQGAEVFSRHTRLILLLMKILLPPLPLQMRIAPFKQNPGHAFCFFIFLYYLITF